MELYFPAVLLLSILGNNLCHEWKSSEDGTCQMRAVRDVEDDSVSIGLKYGIFPVIERGKSGRQTIEWPSVQKINEKISNLCGEYNGLLRKAGQAALACHPPVESSGKNYVKVENINLECDVNIGLNRENMVFGINWIKKRSREVSYYAPAYYAKGMRAIKDYQKKIDEEIKKGRR